MTVASPQDRRFLKAVPDLLCEKCMELAAELETKTELLRRQAMHQTSLMEEVAGAHEAARAAGKEITTLKRRITRQANEDTEAEAIRAICEDWKRDHPRSSIAEGGRRWEVAKRAHRLMKDDPAGPVAACLEALEGLRLRPYQQYDRRYPGPGEGRVKRDDIEHALGDEVRLERCRAYARWARMVPSEQWFELHRAQEALADLYWRRAVYGPGLGYGEIEAS